MSIISVWSAELNLCDCVQDGVAERWRSGAHPLSAAVLHRSRPSLQTDGAQAAPGLPLGHSGTAEHLILHSQQHKTSHRCKKCFSYLDFLSCFKPKYLKILKSRRIL